MKKKLHLKKLLLVVMSISLSNLWGQVTTFSYTGSFQNYTVPVGVTSIQIESWGAQGGTGTFGGITPNPGLGGYAIGTLDVTPGDIIRVYVGGAGASSGPGGFNGGGQAGTSYGAAGGGASDARVSPYGPSDRVIVGAGGGGAAFGSTPSNGGHGGALIGIAGQNGDSFVGGGGGTQVAGGAAGCCYGAATAGTFGNGGGPGDYHNAGGGGGWYGGGSGAGQAGAGGGSSYLGGVTDGSTTAGIRTGNGQVIITVLCTALTVTVSDTEVCDGDEVILDATSILAGTISWDGGVVNGEAFTPPVGTTTYTATSSDAGDCDYSVEIIVLETPEVIGTSTYPAICLGESFIFLADGADSYVWDPADIVTGDEYTPAVAGIFAYTLTGTDALTGCSSTYSGEAIVNALPEVSANASDLFVCIGEEVTFTGSGALTYVWDMDVEDGTPVLMETVGVTTYTVAGTDENGCMNTASVDVEVAEEISIAYVTTDELFGSDGTIDATVSGGYTPYTFDWDNDATGDFDDTEDLSGLAGGTYILVVKDANGCMNTITANVNSQLGIEDLTAAGIVVYPNPTTDQVTIMMEGTFNYQLTNVNGETIENGIGNKQAVLSMVDLPTGVYFVTLTANSNTNTVKIIKN